MGKSKTPLFSCVYFNSNPGGIGMEKTSKPSKIYFEVALTGENMKKLCYPSLFPIEYFVLSLIISQLPYYITFFNPSK